MIHPASPGFSLPLTLIFLVVFIILIFIFGWIVLPIAAGIFLLITLAVVIHDWIKRSKYQENRASDEESLSEVKSSSLNLILYRAIFNRSEEQARAIADDIGGRESPEFIQRAISEIQSELTSPSISLADLHPYAGDPKEEEIRTFLTTVLRGLKKFS
jgi:hypothetical protein